MNERGCLEISLRLDPFCLPGAKVLGLLDLVREMQNSGKAPLITPVLGFYGSMLDISAPDALKAALFSPRNIHVRSQWYSVIYQGAEADTKQ